MNWFYATKDKTQAGPVDDAALEALFRSGAINAETLIWREGMETWTPYASILAVPAGTLTAVAPDEGTARCAECGQVFATDQLISLAGRSVCASCKPLAVQKFQEDPDIRVFLISLKAGGVGLNLTAADYVYIVDPWWNPAVEQQAIDRTHRIGQVNKIFAYKMICKDTVEEKILQLQQRKKQLANELVTEDAGFIKKLTKDDIAFLFS